MSHPLIVEAAESLFVPVLVHNNKKGTDETILKKFKEPAWNNPVIRFVDSAEKDVIARRSGVWTTGGVADRMLRALRAKNLQNESPGELPEYLRFVAAEENGRDKIATFAMHCYWQGEVDLGGLAGVKNTTSAWLQGKEVVELVYDPKIVSYEKLTRTAQKLRCASTVFARTQDQFKIAKSIVGEEVVVLTTEKSRLAKASDQRYYLQKTPLKHLPLTPMQATKINSAILRRVNYDSLISPEQSKMLKQIVAAKKNAATARQLDQLTSPAMAKRPESAETSPSHEERLANYAEKLAAILGG